MAAALALSASSASATYYQFFNNNWKCGLTTTYSYSLGNVTWGASGNCDPGSSNNITHVFLSSSVWDPTGEGYNTATTSDYNCDGDPCNTATYSVSGSGFRRWAAMDQKTTIEFYCFCGLWEQPLYGTTGYGSLTPQSPPPTCIDYPSPIYAWGGEAIQCTMEDRHVNPTP
jgi:hypothetical protein